MPVPILIATIMRPKGETGVQTHFQSFAAWVKSEGNSISITTPFDSPKWKVYPIFALRRLIDPITTSLGVWWYRHWHTLFLQEALRLKLAGNKPCIIYAQCPLSAYAALNARTSPDQYVYLVTHFNISQADEWASKGKIKKNGWLFNSIRKFEESTLTQLDAIVFVSDFMRRELISRQPKLAKIKNRVIPNFLPDPIYKFDKKNIKTDLICIGTLEPRKNQIYALYIIAAASYKLGQPLTLTIIGDGPDRAMLEKIAIDLGVADKVTFLGYIPHAASELSGHRAYLHVSKMESFGIVLIEAMSHGLPVFAPSVGGIPEVFTDGVEGRLIPLDDPKSSAKMILEWLNSKETIDRASLAARNCFLSKFEESKVASCLFEFISNPIK